MNSRQRRGLTSIWILLFVPVLMIFVSMLLNSATLWLARVEMETSMEASALTAVKHWGKAGGGDTELAREFGVQIAKLNRVRGEGVLIFANFNPANPNQNDKCVVNSPTDEANLVFGSVLDNDPDMLVFNPNLVPNCGVGRVLIDATGQSLTDNNNWGIAFLNDPTTPADLRVERVVIDLRAGGGDGTFSGPRVLSDDSHPLVRDQSGNIQSDFHGLPAPSSQVSFSLLQPHQLEIRFHSDPGSSDDGFAPGDRMRFGANTTDVSKGSGSDDGDGIGRDGVTATVYFRQGVTPLPPVTITFRDNTDRRNDCHNPAQTAPDGSLIVHPTDIPNLPCPAASAANNNGQSFLTSNARPRRLFAVRAQIVREVKLPAGWLFGIGKRQVRVHATAIFDCETCRVRLVRPDEVIPCQ